MNVIVSVISTAKHDKPIEIRFPDSSTQRLTVEAARELHSQLGEAFDNFFGGNGQVPTQGATNV